jgi:hypothetical protein
VKIRESSSSEEKRNLLDITVTTEHLNQDVPVNSLSKEEIHNRN